MVTASWFVGRHRNTATKLAAYDAASWPWAMPAALQRALLYGGHAVHPVRRGSGFMMPWAVVYRKLPALTGSRFFGFWEMLVYLGFVAVGLYYIVRKGILNWSQDKADL
jgi:NADH-quinone oxidoreductase subunit A